MKYLQLFNNVPPLSLMNDLFACYGISGFDDNNEFSRKDLETRRCVHKLIDLIPELIMYYVPCKAKVYLNDLNEKRAITILSQFLRMYGYELYRKERIMDKRKCVMYRLCKKCDKTINIHNTRANMTVTFD
jgi:hypothetical protein